MILNAEGTDNDINRLSDRNAQFPQRAIISGGARGKIGIQKRHDSVPAQPAFDACCMDLVSGALETSSRMRSPIRSGSLLAAASSRAVADV